MTEAEQVERIRSGLTESAGVKEALLAEAPRIRGIVERVAATFRGGGRLYACGNGGSACDAMHLVEELVARYAKDRPGLPAHHLLDAPTITCWSNDYDFTTAFSRQVETLMRPGDLLVAISTSGNSANVVLAAEAAHAKGAWTLGLTGRSGGELVGICTEVIRVPSDSTARIQEAHITLIHLFCELLEDNLFGSAEPEE